MIASITTKYSGPTDRSGSRIIAKAMFAAGRTGTPDSKRTTKAWDHSLSNEENHRQAAFKALSAGGLIHGDYDLTGFRSDDGTGYWSAVAKEQPAPDMDNLRLVVEDLACYALVGWEDEMEDDRPEELAVWKTRIDAALKAVGSKHTYDGIKPLLG